MKFFKIFFFTLLGIPLMGQNLEITVLDSLSNDPIIAATISFQGEEDSLFLVTDNLGKVSTQLKGRVYLLEVRALGYKSYTVNQEFKAEEQGSIVIKLSEAYILGQAAVIRGSIVREPQKLKLTRDFFTRIPGAFNDPSRLLIKFPGLSAANDQSNQLIVRGLAPHMVRWSLNEAPIVNPNHTSNAGTLGDQAASSGGGVNMFSGNVIDSYEFISAPLSEEYYNAAAGVSNTAVSIPSKINYSIGLIGTEISYAKNSEDLNVGFNYRYSTLGILSALGVDLGDEQIGFQDLLFHIKKKYGNHSILFNSVWGNSKNYHKYLGEESKNFKDIQDIDFKANQWLNSIQHKYKRSKLSTNTTLNYSTRNASRESFTDPLFPEFAYSSSTSLKEHLVALINKTQVQLSERMSFVTMAQLNYLQFQNELKSISQSDQILLAGLKYSSNKYQLGLHIGGVNYFETLLPEARLKLRRTWNRNALQFQASYQNQSVVPEIRILQEDLQYYSSQNYLIGFMRNVKNGYLQVSGFLNYFNNLPAGNSLTTDESTASYFDRIDLIAQVIQDKGFNQNNKAYTVGAQGQYEFIKANKYQFIQALSLYNIYGDLDSSSPGFSPLKSSYEFGYTYASSFSYISNLNGSKKLILSSTVQGRGGGFESPINLIKSKEENKTIFAPETKSIHMKPYFRIDLKVDYLFGSNQKHKLSLDIQNLLNTENQAYNYYDPLSNTVVGQNQLGLIPILKFSSQL